MVEQQKPNQGFSLGFGEFFLKMTDPSPDDLREFILSISQINDVKKIEEIQWNLENAKYKPLQEKLEKGGYSKEQANQIENGVCNTEKLIGEMISELKYGNFNPDNFTNYAIENAFLQKEEGKVKENIKSLKSEPDLKKRAKKARKAKNEIMAFVKNFNVSLKESEGDEILNPTWKDLINHARWSTRINTEHLLAYADFLTHSAVVTQTAIERLAFENKLKKIQQIDMKEFDNLRLQYGAKAANLLLLSGLAEDINGQWDNFAHQKLEVPEFQPVEVNLYKKWKAREDIDSELKPFFDWASKLKDKTIFNEELRDSDIMVRSSAVFSEDGELLTGAGIYESVKVPAGSSYEEFKKAVLKVYKSVKSPKAVQYRKQNGVKKEEMGLVIQRFAGADTHFSISHKASNLGYLNTSAHGIAELMEFVTETSRNFINKANLDYYLPLDTYFDELEEIFHYAPDKYKINERSLRKTAQIAQVIEKIWGANVQIEFVFGESKINIVQVRKIPANLKGNSTVEFPNLTPCHSGWAVGVGDMELKVSTRYNEFYEEYDHSQEKALVILWANHEWSFTGNPKSLPKEGAVVIADNAGRNGHIQTLCAERGLICLYPDNDPDSPELSFSELKQLKRVRVVSDGIKGQIYKLE